MKSTRSHDPASGASTVRRLLRALQPRVHRVALGTVLGIVAGALAVGGITTLAPVLDVILEPGGIDETLARLRGMGALGAAAADRADAFAGGSALRLLAVFLGVMVVLSALAAVATFAHKVIVELVTSRTQLDLAEQLYDRITEQDEHTLARLGAGTLSARFSYDLDMTGKAIGTLIGILVLEPCRFVFALGAALFMSWKLVVVSLAVVPPAALVLQLLGRRIRKAAEGMLAKRSEMLSRVHETVTALPAVQVYGREDRERSRFRQVTGRVYAWTKRLARLEAANGPGLQLAEVLAIAPVLWFGGWLVVNGELRKGALMAVFALLGAAWGPLRKTAGAANRLQGGIAGAARLFGSIDMPRRVEERSGAQPFPPVAHEVRWDGVRIVHADGRVALDGVSFHAPAGRTTALVGPSGSGKTTALHMLPRLLDPDDGSVTLDGRDVRDCTLVSLRARLALVTQHSRLLGGTLAENIAYARPAASAEEIAAAVRIARVDEIADRLPQGLETVLDEGGAGLSGGERQRVAIARAVVRDPEILLLDEPTSALDPENERLVEAAMTEMARGRTTIVVAHRRETVLAADHVVVLAGGRVEAEGTPDDVAVASATFRELFGDVVRQEA